MQGLVGKKTNQTQGFLQDGTRVPLTVISAMGNRVAQLKTQDKDGYNSIKLAFGTSRKKDKAGKNLPAFFREIQGDVQTVQLDSQINPSGVFKPGDIIDVTGISKGKGFAGVVKRHHFKGGPRTHGQSDRERAPGSIGQTTTPGHVYKGKRMAGHMGHQQATVKNLEVIEITSDGAILVKGLIPGGVNSIVVIKKVGENKKFVPLYKESDSQPTTLQDDAKPQASPSETRLPESEEKQAKEPQSVLDSPASGQPPVADNSKKEEVKENAS